MPITITLTGDNPAQVAYDLAHFHKAIINELVAQTAKATTIAPAAPQAEPANPVEAAPAAPAAEVKVEKPKRAKKAEKAEPVEQPEPPAEPEVPAAATRADLVQVIKTLHKDKGDAILPKVKGILEKYGAKMQSEVKPEDLDDVVGELKELAA